MYDEENDLTRTLLGVAAIAVGLFLLWPRKRHIFGAVFTPISIETRDVSDEDPFKVDVEVEDTGTPDSARRLTECKTIVLKITRHGRPPYRDEAELSTTGLYTFNVPAGVSKRGSIMTVSVRNKCTGRGRERPVPVP